MIDLGAQDQGSPRYPDSFQLPFRDDLVDRRPADTERPAHIVDPEGDRFIFFPASHHPFLFRMIRAYK